MADSTEAAATTDKPTEQENTAKPEDGEAKAPEQPTAGEATAAAAEGSGSAEQAEASPKPTVILHQFPRPPNPQHGPNLSSFCLKMETYLRMAKIPYEVKVAQTKEGPKNKLPFIKVDGQTVGDTGFCIKFLRKRFNVTLDDNLTEEQKALGHCVLRMVEESSYWTIIYRRWVERPEDMPTMFMERPPLKVRLALKLTTKQLRQAVHGQGTGRHSPAEVAELAGDDLRALSTILGSKPFFLGDEATSTDASVFGVLAVMLWMLPDSAQEKLLTSELKNLEEFCQRMRQLYWPDWESLYTSPKPQQKEKAPKSKETENPQGKAEEKPVETTGEKADEKPEEKPQEAAEEKPQEKTEEAPKEE